MFVSPPPTSSAIPAASPHASVSPRSSRLRGLSYLRNIGNYTHSHILSRDHHNPPTASSSSSSSSTSPRRHISLLSRSASLSHSSRNPTSASTATAGSPTIARTASTRAAATNSTNPEHRSRTANFRHSVIGTITGLSNHDSSSSSSTSSSSSSQSPISTPSSRESSEASQRSGSPVTSSSPEPPPQPHPRPAAAGAASRPAAAHSTAAASQSPTAVVATTTTPPPCPGPAQDMPAMAAARDTAASPENLPSIRFSAYYDPRTARPSLTFQPLSRTLPTGTEIIKVGRYSERDAQPPVPVNCPTAAPVGFKSKVVSRRHCEFWFEGGKWYIRDVKSSSGTFLNHIRLSPPGTESKPYPVNDGDIIQLGIDFKGGEEQIFRCVKMRLELNRGWQSKLNAYNMSTHKRLRSLVANGSQNSTSQDCSICLNSIAPCQSLFVAPCSHTWHYKCIRSLLTSPQYPIFVCPNCRAAADLEAEVDDPSEEWQKQLTSEESADDAPAAIDATETRNEDSLAASASLTPPTEVRRDLSPEAADSPMGGDVTMRVDMATPSPNPSLQPQRLQNGHSSPVPIPPSLNSSGAYTTRHQNGGGGPSTIVPGSEGPITPRNNAGPWVFDGSAGGVPVGAPLAGGISGAGIGEMRSLDSAALETASRT